MIAITSALLALVGLVPQVLLKPSEPLSLVAWGVALIFASLTLRARPARNASATVSEAPFSNRLDSVRSLAHVVEG